MKQFLVANPAKAAAWVAALNTDATLRWPTGALTVADIPAYLDTLTHSSCCRTPASPCSGTTTASPVSTLPPVGAAEGGAVLIDPYGVPRAKCYCGNPLTAPVPSNVAVSYVGTPWPNFDPTQITVTSPSGQPVTSFTVTDIKTGQPITVTVGSGTSNAAELTTTAAPTTTLHPPRLRPRPRRRLLPHSTLPPGAGAAAERQLLLHAAGRTAGPDFLNPIRVKYRVGLERRRVRRRLDEGLNVGASNPTQTIDQYFPTTDLTASPGVLCASQTRSTLANGWEIYEQTGCTWDAGGGVEALPDFYAVATNRPDGTIFTISSTNRAWVDATMNSVVFP
ncbi:MAG: DUF6777 domain-containing protein [Ilumatobacteraceae bacterium]